MKAFAHRILNSEARNVGNAGELTGAIHFYSGSREVQDLSRLNKKLSSVWWTNAGEGMTAPLSEKGYQAVAKMHNQLNMQALMRSVLKAVKKSMSDEAAFNAVAPEYDGEVSVQSLNRFQEELWSAAWAVMRANEQNAVEATDNVEGAVVDEVLLKVEKTSTDAGLDSTASLTEYAYQQVAALPGNHEMKALVTGCLTAVATS